LRVVQVADISKRAACYGQASQSYTQTQRDYRSTFQKNILIRNRC
jgi:hypothetical protein